jgi:hypothetical protein
LRIPLGISCDSPKISEIAIASTDCKHLALRCKTYFLFVPKTSLNSVNHPINVEVRFVRRDDEAAVGIAMRRSRSPKDTSGTESDHNQIPTRDACTRELTIADCASPTNFVAIEFSKCDPTLSLELGDRRLSQNLR